MTDKSFGRFITETTGVSYTRRGDEIEIDDVLLSEQERDALLVEFEAWEPRPEVPEVVSMRRARLAMHSAGILEDIETAIETADKAAQIEWEYATEVRRDHPLIEAIGSQLQLSAEQIDALFIAADQID